MQFGVGWLNSDFRIHSVPQVVLMVLLGWFRHEQVGCNCLMTTIKPTLISENQANFQDIMFQQQG